jgi:hypothetical protein
VEVLGRADEFTEADGLEACEPAEGGRFAESCAWRLEFVPEEAPAERAVFIVFAGR